MQSTKRNLLPTICAGLCPGALKPAGGYRLKAAPSEDTIKTHSTWNWAGRRAKNKKKVKRDTGNLDDGERHSCHVHGSGLVCRLSFTLVPFCLDRSAAEYKFCCPCFVQSVMIFLFGISTVTFGMPTVFLYNCFIHSSLSCCPNKILAKFYFFFSTFVFHNAYLFQSETVGGM